MNETNLMDYIPPEQIGYIIAAIIGLTTSIAAALGIFVRWLFGYFARVQDEKLNAMRQERELEKIEAEAKQRQRDMEIQRQLDETHTGRETMLRWFDALSEERKDNAEQRKASERKEAIYIQAIQGIESNAAATFNLMKEMSDRLSRHTESDETMEAQQMKIIAQGDKTLSKVDLLASGLEEVKTKLDQILAATQQNPNKTALEQLEKTVNELLSLAKAAPKQAEIPPQAVAATTQVSATPVTPPETNETQKELKKEE